MTAEQAVNLVIIGVTLGAVYAVMALGLSFIYGITKIFNYAQGAFFTWGAYFAYMLSTKYLHLPYPAVVIITVIIMFLFGLGYEKAFMYPLRRFPRWDMTAIIVTLGSALLLDNLALVLFGSRAKRIPYLVEGSFTLGGFVITKHEVVTLVVALFVVFLLILFLGKVRKGMAMRGVAQDMIGARIVGIPINRIFSHAFGIAAALAGISAILLAPKILVYPTVGWLVFVKAFVIMVFGGVGSIKGTAVAAFILAMVEAFVTFYFGGIWGMPIFILVLVIMLTIRPRGLFGTW
jgi:branched-chain amino acid transport system permease protein